MLALVNEIGAEEVQIQTERLDISHRDERRLIKAVDGKVTLWIVAVLEDHVLGSAEISRGRQRKNQHVAEVGIALRRDARGVGLGSAMMRSMLRWARTVGIRKVFLGVFSSNRAAIRLYRHLGFVQEGRLKGQVVLHGKPADVLLMSLWLGQKRHGHT